MSLRKRRIDKIRSKNRSQSRNTQEVIISSPDNTLVAIIIILVSFGAMAVFSAGAPEGVDLYNNPAYYFIKHIFFVAIGLFFMISASKFDYKKLKNMAIPVSFVTIGLIAATYIPGLGKESYGAARWLPIAGFQFQPSELAKISTILLIASTMTEVKTVLSSKLFINLAIVGVMVLLILNQPNLSVSMIICMITAVLLIAGGMSSTLMLIPAGAGLMLLIPKLHGYQMDRITGWLNPWADPQGKGYNLIQSWYAIGSGGIFGVGFGNSKQKLFWLPFRHTDFIFAVIAEEFGLIGCLILIGLFLTFIHRGFIIANRCSDTFGRLLTVGIVFSIGIQAFINIAVTTGVMPVTGVPLPLISYGGTSVVVTMLMLGILLNISRKRIKKIQPKEAESES